MGEGRTKKIAAYVVALWTAHEEKVVTVIALVLVAALSFEAGIIHGKKRQQQPLIIERPLQPPLSNAIVSGEGKDRAQQASSQATQTVPAQDSAQCRYVGSKNSNKYYPPSCSFAKRIKQENLRCFISDEEAQQQGYQRSNAC